MSNVYIIPSYCEINSLPKFLNELAPIITLRDKIVICDDSPIEIAFKLEKICREISKKYKRELSFLHNLSKDGRGAAVLRGMKYSYNEFPEALYFVECDADGSHRPIDIINLRSEHDATSLIIGSRYLKHSKIQNWSLRRRFLSKFLNILIPKLFKLKVKDITNGLRSYSRESVALLISKCQTANGFIYLSEQLILIVGSGFSIKEVPIIFSNRISDKSTVTIKDLINSLKQVYLLLKIYKPHKIRK